MTDYVKEQSTRRTVVMTDRDQEFLAALGGNNVSAGIRVAVVLARAMNVKCDFIPRIEDVATKPLKDGE